MTLRLNIYIKWCVLSWMLCIVIGTVHAQEKLTHWPPEAAAQLNNLIKANAHQGAYAVFDADNTTYRNDLTESLLSFMEMKGALTRDTMNAALKLIPFKDTATHKESLSSYYVRLCAIDDQVCYPWIAQVFSGFTLRQLKGYVDALLAYGKPIPAEYVDGDIVKQKVVNAPRFFTGMQELYKLLMENGIQVYVMSAASEELVRMVLADPQYGYHVKPENVIGVSVLLKDRRNGELTTARKLISEGTYDPVKMMDLEYGTYLWAPLTWYAGKSAGIVSYIDAWRKPILVGGDTPVSDGPMLFQSTDVAKGGLRVWVNRKDSLMQELTAMQRKNTEQQKMLGLPVTADKNWVVVTPDQIQ